MILALLTSLAAIVTALKAVPGVTGDVARWISIVENAVTNAIEAHKQAKTQVDPALLTPEAPVTPGVDPAQPQAAPQAVESTQPAAGLVSSVLAPDQAQQAPSLPPGAPPPFTGNK